jgi:hypothetical protein
MRRLWLGLLLCACSGSSDNEVDGTVLGFSLNARDALYLVHNGRQVFVVSDQDNTCRKLASQSLGGQVRLLELYLWNPTSTDPATLVEGTYDVANDSASLDAHAFFGVGSGCGNGVRWFGASSGRVILIQAGIPEPGDRSQVAFLLEFGNEQLAGHADAAYCELPQTGTIPCIFEDTSGP